jgi:glycerophosphoryl diester phosphodiesterase
MLQETLNSYREALRLWLPFLAVHLFIRLVTTAALVPVIGLLLAVSLSFSEQSALTDQDIARFLLTPAGAIGALAVISLLIVAAVLDVAVMTAILRQGARHPLRSLQAAAGFVPGALPRLARFALALLVRVLILALPFLIAAALIAAALLRDYDINYYLTNRPPAFLAAVGLIGLVAVGLVLLLAERLTGWAVALHLTVFDALPVRRAFEESRARMAGHRLDLLGHLAWWLALRMAAAAVIGFFAGIVAAELPDLMGDRLRLMAGSLILVGLAWSAANAVLNAVANGALADLLNDEFTRALEGRIPRAAAAQASAGPVPLLSRANLTLAALGVLSLSSIGAGGLLLETVSGKEAVTVIGHRGAAGLRPENTMAAIAKAIEDGADWVEIDVQETADGQIIVAHDSDFMKSARVPTKVWDATMADIAAIDIGSWFDPAYADERAPLLSDVLAAAKGRSRVIIELKYYGHDVDLENRVIALVEAAGMERDIATMSLKYPAVQKMLTLRPDWRTGVLAATAVGDLAGLDGDFLAVNAAQVSAGLVARADAAGKDVYAWTVNDPMGMMRMISLGVDGLITDDPGLARAVIDYRATLPTAARLLIALGDRVGVVFDLDPPEELRP